LTTRATPKDPARLITADQHGPATVIVDPHVLSLHRGLPQHG
jgi:hypothetical protein